jgi:precorrin-3B synthase
VTMSRRRGACPGLSTPMPTGDGLLVRLMPVAAIPLDAMAGFCEAARRHGNGIVEITARGSLQVRGLTPYSAPLFAAAVADLGIDAQEGVPVIAGFGDDAVDALTAELRCAIADARLALSPKVSVVVDGRGPLHLDGLYADVRLRAVASAEGLRFHLGISSGEQHQHAAPGGDVAATTWLGMVAPEDAVSTVIDVLKTIAAHGPAARAADILSLEGVAAFQPAVTGGPVPAPPPRVPADMIGVHAMRDGAVALGVGLAFGHAHADALADLMRMAVRHCARAARPAPDRAVLLTGISVLDVHGLKRAAERSGFVVDADDPRCRIAACPGGPACASGLIPARSLAATLAPALPRDLAWTARGVSVHLSGCSKGCAHPRPAPLTVVGTPEGCGVVHGGSAHETPHHHADLARLGDTISRLAAEPVEAAHG